MREKQIEEMAKHCPCYIAEKCCIDNELPERCDMICQFGTYAEALYNAGYRKQSEVIDEFAKRLSENLDISVCGFSSEEVTYDVELTIDRLVEEMKGGAK